MFFFSKYNVINLKAVYLLYSLRLKMAALKKSHMWNHFEKINNNKQASCLHCQMKITLQKDGNTSSMSKHLLRAHSIDNSKHTQDDNNKG